MDYELKHKWQLAEDAWYIRFYVHMWEAEKTDINFCKLFWAYVFMPLALFLRYVFPGPLIWVLSRTFFPWFDARKERRLKLASASGPSIPVEQKETGPSRMMILLTAIGRFFAWIGFKFESFWFTHRKWILPAFSGLMILASVIGVIAIIVIIIKTWSTPGFLELLEVVGIVLGAVAVALVVVVALSWFHDKRQTKKKNRPNKMTLRKVLRQGYIAVKTNTCPQIDLVETKNTSQSSE